MSGWRTLPGALRDAPPEALAGLREKLVELLGSADATGLDRVVVSVPGRPSGRSERMRFLPGLTGEILVYNEHSDRTALAVRVEDLRVLERLATPGVHRVRVVEGGMLVEMDKELARAVLEEEPS